MVGLFFHFEKILAYTDKVEVILRNIEEKIIPVRATEDPTKILRKHKFYCHHLQSRNYTLETNKIGLVFKLPATDCFATDKEPENPKYWEITIKNEACGFLHRFIIDVLDIPDDNKDNL